MKLRKYLLGIMAVASVACFVSCQEETSTETPAQTTTTTVPSTTTTTVTQSKNPTQVHSVTFNYNNGQASTVVHVANNTPVDEPTPPEYEGYLFIGWYLGDELYDFSSNVTASITLEARYVSLTTSYTISFVTNCDTSIEPVKVNGNSTLNAPEVSLSKSGYTFVGWYKSLTDTQAYDFTSAVTSSFTLYAKWEKDNVSYKVTFKDTDGSTISTESVAENTTVTKPSNPTKEGYIFSGWYESLTDTEAFDFDTLINSNLTLYAKYSKELDNTSFTLAGYSEGAYVEFESSTTSGYTIKYKAVNTDDLYTLDNDLIRQISTTKVRADILGLTEGTYVVCVYNSENKLVFQQETEVSSYDRSGYAHFNNSGVGAYNDDGTLKDNALVVYVTDETKNTVTVSINGKTYTGLSAILKAQVNNKYPLVIRIIGTINAATWNKISYTKGSSNLDISAIVGANGKKLTELLSGTGSQKLTESMLINGKYNSMSTDISNGITVLNGLTNQIAYAKGEFDSYYNMLDINGASNVTVEGVGNNAMLYQWGFTWKNCSNIEVRNLTFDDYTEDACSFEGPDNSKTLDGFTTGHIWIHNNTFNEGKNNWDVCPEQDKHEGDGATDFKKNAYITVSYNHYYKNHKTGLVGGGDTQYTAAITFHHNYYENCTSRLPLARNANMHMYNNYYYKSTGTNMSIRVNGYAFIEGCYFESCNNPIEIKNSAAAKVFNSVFTGCRGSNGGKVVTSRTATVTNTNTYGTTFDIDSSIFYYDSTNKVSNVKYLTDAATAKKDCIKYAGVLK